MGIIELAKMIAIEEAVEEAVEKTTEQVTERVTEQVTERVAEQKSTVFVTNLIANTDFPAEKIASLAQVSVEFVMKVKNQGIVAV